MKNLALAVMIAAPLLAGCLTPTLSKTPTTPAEHMTRAADLGDEKTVAKLLAEGVEPTGEGFDDTIEIANAHGHTNIVKMVMDRCLQIFVPGKNCWGAPTWAAAHGDPAMLQALFARGLKPDYVGFSETPLLVYAASSGNMPNIKFLLRNGADIDAAISVYEVSNARLAAQNSDPARAAIARQNAEIALLNSQRPKTAAPAIAVAPAAPGVSRAELAEMMKAAVESAKKEAPASSPAAYHSAVDAPAYKVAQNPDAYAIVVGAEKYNTLPEARFAERDAVAMAAHLLAMGYPQRNVVLLTGPQATRTGLVKNLEAWLPNNATEKSTVFFYFSGHGAPDAKTSQAYLVPVDGDPQYLEETAYPVKRLYEKLGALKAKRVLVALDSCFSGAGGRSVLAQGVRPLVAKLDIAPAAGKVTALTASAGDEITGALESEGHGLFTYELLKALSETAGRGTADEIYGALKPRVQDEARRQNRAQSPQFTGDAAAGLR